MFPSPHVTSIPERSLVTYRMGAKCLTIIHRMGHGVMNNSQKEVASPEADWLKLQRLWRVWNVMVVSLITIYLQQSLAYQIAIPCLPL